MFGSKDLANVLKVNLDRGYLWHFDGLFHQCFWHFPLLMGFTAIGESVSLFDIFSQLLFIDLTPKQQTARVMQDTSWILYNCKLKRIKETKYFLTYYLKIQSVWEGGRQRPNKSDAYSAEYCLFNPLSDWLGKCVGIWMPEMENHCERKEKLLWDKKKNYCKRNAALIQNSFDLLLHAPAANIGGR